MCFYVIVHISIIVHIGMYDTISTFLRLSVAASGHVCLIKCQRFVASLSFNTDVL